MGTLLQGHHHRALITLAHVDIFPFQFFFVLDQASFHHYAVSTQVVDRLILFRFVPPSLNKRTSLIRCLYSFKMPAPLIQMTSEMTSLLSSTRCSLSAIL